MHEQSYGIILGIGEENSLDKSSTPELTKRNLSRARHCTGM